MKKKLMIIPVLLSFMLLSNPKQAQEVGASSAPYQIPNGGFESGNLTGWNAFGIWKNESGMQAFVNQSRVVNDTYFGSNPYNRDGSYNLGIVWSGVSWEQSAERMGHLRSADFILGGSGYISFKLGGGKNQTTAFVSIRKTSDNTEVARFGNRWFNNTSEATSQYGSSISNAEAFLFKYYFDLSSVVSLGESLYITISETASYDWCILSADSFVTYIKDSPAGYPANQQAENIVPVILGVDTAANSIKNGAFDSADDWSWPESGNGLNKGWARSSSGRAKSNENSSAGDSGIGVIRSSAFTLDGDNKYMKWDWGGGLRHDKRIFVSIKEVGTNIEKVRLVRRDNLSTKENNDYDNHKVNLTDKSLDYGKKYYLEFVDNKTDSWGVSFVDNVMLINKTTYDGITADDKAVVISDLATSFPQDTGTQAAIAYASYFLEQTAPKCELLQGDQVPWTTLGTEYSSLTATAKDYFVAGGTTETNVVAARTRYLFLYGKYGEAEEWSQFMTNSSGTPYSGLSEQVTSDLPDNNLIMIVVAMGIMTLVTASLFVFRKYRKVQ